MRIRGNQERFDSGIEATVYHGELKLVTEIVQGPDASDHYLGVFLFRAFYNKPAPMADADVLIRLHHFGDHLETFIGGEGVLFLGIGSNNHDDFVEYRYATIDDVQVTICWGVKGPWKERS